MTIGIGQRLMTFYLEGREDVMEAGVEAEVDIDALVKKIAKSDNVSLALYSVTREAAEKALAHLETTTERSEWVSEHEQGIAEADVDDAYLAFCVGRIDEVRYMLEQDVIGRMIELDDEGHPDNPGPTDPEAA